MITFENFKKKYGLPTACHPVSTLFIEQYEELPQVLLREWKTSGWCQYNDGLIWLVNPDDFVDVLEDWLGKSTSVHVIARTAFGCLIIWDGRQAYLVDVLFNVVLPMSDSIEEVFDGFLCDEAILQNDLRKSDFDRAVERLGVLESDECYGYFPAISLGGPGTPDTLQRVKMREHLALLAELR